MLWRAYQSSDRDDCVRAFSSNVPTLFIPEELIHFEEFLDRLPGRYFVVIEDAALLGCGGYATGRASGEADIRWTIVHRDHHGQGVGDLLMTACVSELLAHDDYQTVRLETSEQARGFFERWGFRVRAVTPHGIGPGLDRIEMRVELDDAARRHWHEMITGGLTPPIAEQPIPAIEQYKEWADHRYAPGHYLGGNQQPHLDVTRIGPRGRRLSGILIGILALLTTGVAITGWPDGNVLERGASLLFSAIWWVGAFRLFRSSATDADNR